MCSGLGWRTITSVYPSPDSCCDLQLDCGSRLFTWATWWGRQPWAEGWCEGWRARAGLLLLLAVVSTVTLWEKVISFCSFQGREGSSQGRDGERKRHLKLQICCGVSCSHDETPFSCSEASECLENQQNMCPAVLWDTG